MIVFMSDHRTSRRCSVEGCESPHHIGGYCIKHYARVRRSGTTDDPRPRGNKKASPYWTRWTQLKKREALAPEWAEDFWTFVDGISPQPENTKKLCRHREDEPYGPDNFFWMKTPTRDDTLAYYRDWQRKNPLHRKAIHFRESYGITIQQYRDMYDAQGGCCAICGAKGASLDSVTKEQAEDGYEVLHVDHDHQLHEVRDLLCKHCNRGIGCFEDNPALLSEAVGYLLQHRPLPKLFQYPRERVGKDVPFWGLKVHIGKGQKRDDEVYVMAWMSLEDRLEFERKRLKVVE